MVEACVKFALMTGTGPPPGARIDVPVAFAVPAAIEEIVSDPFAFRILAAANWICARATEEMVFVTCRVLVVANGVLPPSTISAVAAVLRVVNTTGFVGPVYVASIIGISVRDWNPPAVDRRRLSVIVVVAW
jgi:hypothetical protein